MFKGTTGNDTSKACAKSIITHETQKKKERKKEREAEEASETYRWMSLTPSSPNW